MRSRSSLVTAILVVASALTVLAATPQPDSDALGVGEVRLDNGLRIVVLERSTSPTFAAMYQFGVGAAMDPKGRTGIAHLLEHMMFKGSSTIGTLDPEREKALMDRLVQLWDELHVELDREQDPFATPNGERVEQLKAEIEKVSAEQKALVLKNEYDEVMTRAGSVGLNAFTSSDITAYIIQLPANRLELWFRMESDRLLNSMFREFYSERDVVQSERRQTSENTPYGRISEALDSLMFTAHPYRNPVVGWPGDLERMSQRDAEEYFTTYYSPSNCTMVLVGDVEVAEVERLAKKYFGPWQRQQIPRLQVTAEPEQKGARRQVVEFDAEPQLAIGWVTVPEGHPDQAALDVFASILGGLNSSRLDTVVVQQERLATRVGTDHSSMRYAGVFYASGTPNEGRTVAELESAVEREIQRIVDGGVTAEELERAKVAVEVSRVRMLKSNMGMAFRLATSVRLTGSTDYFERYEQLVSAVTGEQVQQVAAKYLRPGRKNVVELVPTPGAGGGSRAGQVEHQRGRTVSERGAAHSKGFAQAMEMVNGSGPVRLTVPEIGKDVERVVLPSGVTVFIKEDHLAPSVDMAFSWKGGANTTPVENLAPFELADQLLTEGGTEALDPIALQERVDELGMRFSIRTGSTASSASFWSLARNFDQSFGLAMDMLMKPRLDPERLATVKAQYVDGMRRRYENPAYGSYLVRRYVFDHDHPRLGFEATRQQVEAVTPEEIRALWERYFGRDNLFVTVVGDFDRAALLETVEKTFAPWRLAEDSERVWITREAVVKPGVFVVEKDLPNPAIVFAQHLEVDRSAPLQDHAAVEILNEILGGSGFRSRLMERIRSDEGLTYGIYSRVQHEGRPGEPGALTISYQTGKDKAGYSIRAVLEEYRRIIASEVSSAEVQEQVEAWRNSFIFNYVNEFYSVSRLMFNELDDRPYDYDSQELEAVQKVTVADVKRVAEKYFKPENLSICVYGSLTDADREALGKDLGVTVLPRSEVFGGGFDVPARAPQPAPPVG